MWPFNPEAKEKFAPKNIKKKAYMEGLHQIENTPEIAAVEGEKVVVRKGDQTVAGMQGTVENSTEIADVEVEVQLMTKEREEQLTLKAHPFEEARGAKKSVSALRANSTTAELGSAPAKKRVRFEEREDMGCLENNNCNELDIGQPLRFETSDVEKIENKEPELVEKTATENLDSTTVEASAAQGEAINCYAPLKEVCTNGQSWSFEDTVERAGHLDEGSEASLLNISPLQVESVERLCEEEALCSENTPEAKDLRVKEGDDEKRVGVRSGQTKTSGLQDWLEV